MGLANYCSASFNLASELRYSLAEHEVEALHRALTGKKVRDWVRWRISHDELIFDFVSSTQKQRTKKKFEEFRLYLTMAGIQHCLEAHALLSVITSCDLTPGGSYRDMAAFAGDAYSKLLYNHDIPYWPFPDFESPFVDDPFRNREP